MLGANRVAAVLALLVPCWSAAAQAQPAEPPARPAASDDTGDSAVDEPPSPAQPVDAAGPSPASEDASIDVSVIGPPALLQDATVDATRLSGERLRTGTRASSLEELSQRAADLYVSSRGLVHGIGPGASGGMTIRGLGGSPNTQVVVVEDGVVDAQGIFGHPIADAYVPSLIDEALVLEGGDSVLYGSGAMGGAILLRNRWRQRPGFEIHNDAAYGSFDTLRETASFLGQLDDWDVVGAFHALSTDGHRAGAGGSTVVGHAGARYRAAPSLQLSLRNKLIHLEGADPGPVTSPHPSHTYDVWRDQAALQLEWRAEWIRLAVHPYVNVGWHRLYDGFRSEDHTAGTAAEAHLRFARAAQLLVGLGAEGMGGRVDNRSTAEGYDVRGRTELYGFQQLTLRPVDALTLTAGARGTHDTQYGPVLAYKAGGRWRIYRGLYLRSRVARAYRRPTLRELYLPMPTADPDLRPETSLNTDVALGYLSDHVEAAVTGYRTEAHDLIKYFGAWPSAEVVNIDHATFWGIEGHAGLERLGPVSLFVTADWRDVGRYTRQNPAAKLDATVDIRESFGVHTVSGSVTGEWIHGLYMANYERDPLDDVFVVDLTIAYQHRLPAQGLSVEPYAVFRNLLDLPGELIAGYPLPGFHLLGGLRLGFDHG